ESIARKCGFIAEAAELAGIGNVEDVAERAEGWQEGIGRHHLVAARAPAPPGGPAGDAAPLLPEGGPLGPREGTRDAPAGRAGARPRARRRCSAWRSASSSPCRRMRAPITGICPCCARSRPPRRASRADREWPANGRFDGRAARLNAITRATRPPDPTVCAA